MKILISNDDGVESAGILSLAKAVESLGEVVVVAPHRERSTSGHSLTLHKPLRIIERRKNEFATTGTPADCIYLGIREILKTPPDLILSGINRGANLGTDVHYSGTVAAAREGALMNIPSYAFSLVGTGAESDYGRERFEEAGQWAKKVIEATLPVSFPRHTLLNVNIPSGQAKGVRVARQGFRYYANEVTRRIDPRGKPYYWIGGNYEGFEESPLSDCHAVQEGYVSVTPVTIDSTHNNFYTTLVESTVFCTIF